jgi:hypothetical protein
MNAQHGGAEAISLGRNRGGGAEAAVMYTSTREDRKCCAANSIVLGV